MFVFSSLKNFCGVNGFNAKSRRWKRPSNYTPFLASIQFCIRIIGVEYALPTSERNRFKVTEDHTPLIVFKQFWQKWLVEGEPTPFNYVHQLMNYGMNIAKNCKGDDKIRFSADGKRCYYETHQFDMLEWKEMPKEILRNAELILSRRLLFQNSDTVTAVNPSRYPGHKQQLFMGILDSDWRSKTTTERNLLLFIGVATVVYVCITVSQIPFTGPRQIIPSDVSQF